MAFLQRKVVNVTPDRIQMNVDMSSISAEEDAFGSPSHLPQGQLLEKQPLHAKSTPTDRGELLLLKPSFGTTSRPSSRRNRAHPWGPESQGLQEVDTLAGETATVTTQSDRSLLSSPHQGYFYRSQSQKKLAKQVASPAARSRESSAKRTGVLGRALRLDQEELEEDFESRKMRMGIENARQRQKLAKAVGTWKTPYEVDAPRVIMLPRDQRLELSTSGSSSQSTSHHDPLSVEQKIWKGIDALMAVTFSDDDSTTVLTSDVLPKALIKSMSQRSVFSTMAEGVRRASPPSSTSSKQDMPVEEKQQPLTKEQLDELEMAQAALNSFMDILVHEREEEDSLPSLSNVSIQSTSGHSSSDDDDDSEEEKIAMAEIALHNFMDVLTQEVEDSQSKGGQSHQSAIQLLDIFKWTLKVNVDAAERAKFINHERERQFQLEKELEEKVKRREERRKIQREAEEEAERILKEEEKRIVEETRKLAEEGKELVEEAAASKMRKSRQKRKKKRSKSMLPPVAEVHDKGLELEHRLLATAEQLRIEAEEMTPQGEEQAKMQQEGKALDLPSRMTVAERRRAESQRRMKMVEAALTPIVQQPGLPDQQGVPETHASAGEAERPQQLLQEAATTGTDASPLQLEEQQLPSEFSSGTVPYLSSEGGSEKLSDGGSSKWVSKRGVLVDMPSDDEGSIDPATLPNLRAARPSSSSEIARLQQRRKDNCVSDSEFSRKSMPSKLPSQAPTCLLGSYSFTMEASEISIDPATLPNLAETRKERKDMANRDETEAGGVPDWAAIGGRPIVMSKASDSSGSSKSHGSSQSSHLLPSSFQELDDIRATMSESGSTNPSITKLSSKLKAAKPDEAPELKSISEDSGGSSSTEDDDSSTSSTSEESESPLQQSSSSVFSSSFVVGHSPIESPVGSMTDHFFSPRTRSSLIGVLSIAGDVFSDDVSEFSLSKFDMDAFDSESFAFGDFATLDLEPKDGSKGKSMRKKEKDTAARKAEGVHPGLPSKQRSNQVEVYSLGSAGDVHVGSAVHFSSSSASPVEYDDDSSDEITLDSELVDDEFHFGDYRPNVPTVNEFWMRKVPKGSLTRRIAKSFKDMRSKGQSVTVHWPSKRSASKEHSRFSTPKLERRMSSRRCLLHYSDEGTFDRRHVLSAQ